MRFFVAYTLLLASFFNIGLCFVPCVNNPSNNGGATAAAASFISISSSSSSSSSALYMSSKLTRLPSGISPFEKSVAKGKDLQGEFRKISNKSIQDAIRNGVTKMELEFPPLLGGDQSKTAFDDFDNVQELDKNRDFCVQLAPILQISPTILIFPDLKECELAKAEWTGQRFRSASTFTCLEEVAQYYTDGTEFSKPWGTTIASGFNQLLGGGGNKDDNNKGDAGLLGDRSSLDSLDNVGIPKLHLICQPGNGGPVEDWINAEIIHNNAPNGIDSVPTVIVNGALDKVRDGYYASFIFPKLAKTFPFYKSFESVFYLKPVNDKGVYGWLYRVYPEPWQVVLQTPIRTNNGQVRVEETVALVSDKRPTYNEAVQALLSTAASKTVA